MNEKGGQMIKENNRENVSECLKAFAGKLGVPWVLVLYPDKDEDVVSSYISDCKNECDVRRFQSGLMDGFRLKEEDILYYGSKITIPACKLPFPDIRSRLWPKANEAENKREIVFWSTQEDDDRLCESDIDQVIHDHLGEYPKEEWGKELEVYGFAYIEPHVRDGYSVERLIEALDEDFGSPDKDAEITEAMREAERVFHAVVLKEFKPWLCDVVEKRIINIEQWCKDNDYHCEE